MSRTALLVVLLVVLLAGGVFLLVNTRARAVPAPPEPPTPPSSPPAPAQNEAPIDHHREFIRLQGGPKSIDDIGD